jgi:hypothetical protein
MNTDQGTSVKGLMRAFILMKSELGKMRPMYTEIEEISLNAKE